MDMKNNRSPTKEDFIKIRENTGMNRKEFAEYLQIPYRTVQDWELGRLICPCQVDRDDGYKIKESDILFLTATAGVN